MIRPDQAEVREAIAPWAYECVGFEKAGHKGLFLAATRYLDQFREGESRDTLSRTMKKAGFSLSPKTIERRYLALAEVEGSVNLANPSSDDLQRFAAALEKRTNPLTSSESNEWYTPGRYAESVHSLLGGVDVDPASSDQANETIGAETYYTIDDDGLAHDWPGRVFMNPPWGDEGPEFGRRLIQQYNAGITKAAVSLFNAHATDTDWFQPYFAHILCFTDHRIDYDSPEEKGTSSTHGSVFAYLGEDWEGFAEEFEKHGSVVARWNP